MKTIYTILCTVIFILNLSAQNLNHTNERRLHMTRKAKSAKKYSRIIKDYRAYSFNNSLKSAVCFYQLDSIVDSESKMIYQYNSEGRNESIEYYEADFPEEDFYPAEKVVYAYDAEGKIINAGIFEWNWEEPGDWIVDWNEKIIYNGEDKIDTVYISYPEEEGSNELIVDGGDVYYYSGNGNLDSIISYDEDVDSWLPSYKESFNYDEQNRTIENSSFSSENNDWNWELGKKLEYSYTTSGKLARELTYSVDYITDSVYIRYDYTYNYDNKDRLITELSKFRSSAGEALINEWKTSFQYTKELGDTLLKLPNDDGTMYFPPEFLMDMPVVNIDCVWNDSTDLWEESGIYNLFYSKVCSNGDVNISSISLGNKLVIAPNPANEYITVFTQADLPLRNVYITDLSGKQIKNLVVNKDKQIYLGHISSGIYIITVTDIAGNNMRGKLIKW